MLKEKEDAIFVTRKDLDGQQLIAQGSEVANVDYTNELHAFSKHSQVLEGQNKDLAQELDYFCQKDEMIR